MMDIKTPLPPRVMRTYEIYNPQPFKPDMLEIRHDNKTIRYATTRTVFMKEPHVDVEAAQPGHPIVASAKLIKKSNGCKIFLGGDPAKFEKPQWDLVACANPDSGVFTLGVNGKAMRWERVNSSAAQQGSGSAAAPEADPSDSGAIAYELFEQSSGYLLARYTSMEGLDSPEELVATLEFMESSQMLDLFILTSILGIELRRRKSDKKRKGSIISFGKNADRNSDGSD